MMLRNFFHFYSTRKCVANCLPYTKIPYRICVRLSRSVMTVENSGDIDRFIDTLMKAKMKKWLFIKELRNREINGNSAAGAIAHSRISTSDLSEETVDDYIIKYLNSSNLAPVFKECLERKICPSPDILSKAAHIFARSGNASGIDTLMSVARSNGIDDRKMEEYRVFQAEALWRSGESAGKSLDVLCEVYKNQLGLRRFVRSSLRSLIYEVMQSRGEASLVQAKKLVVELASPPYEDPIPLSFLWGRCILSEWFADQQMGIELAEIGRNTLLFRRAIRNRVDAILGEALTNHKVDAVYRLLETLLKLSMYKQSEIVLGKLFDYKYVLGDTRGCEAILEVCAVLHLDIGSTRRKQLDKRADKWRNKNDGILRHKSEMKARHHATIKPTPQYQFKI